MKLLLLVLVVGVVVVSGASIDAERGIGGQKPAAGGQKPSGGGGGGTLTAVMEALRNKFTKLQGQKDAAKAKNAGNCVFTAHTSCKALLKVKEFQSDVKKWKANTNKHCRVWLWRTTAQNVISKAKHLAKKDPKMKAVYHNAVNCANALDSKEFGKIGKKGCHITSQTRGWLSQFGEHMYQDRRGKDKPECGVFKPERVKLSEEVNQCVSTTLEKLIKHLDQYKGKGRIHCTLAQGVLKKIKAQAFP